MTAKQQIATGFLATLIICSVAFMPANADPSPAKPSPMRHSAVVAAKASAPKPARDPAQDLTYN